MLVDWMSTRVIHEDRVRENLRHSNMEEGARKERQNPLRRAVKNFTSALS